MDFFSIPAEIPTNMVAAICISHVNDDINPFLGKKNLNYLNIYPLNTAIWKTELQVGLERAEKI